MPNKIHIHRWRISQNGLNINSQSIDLQSLKDGVIGNKLVLKAFGVAIGYAPWLLWRFRKKLIFSSKKFKRMELFDSLIAYSFGWVSSRKCNSDMFGFCWLQCPSEAFKSL
ncbi:hypothetical protein L1887_39931 [Cichorium endivia]|nr:hypothetical protein L1887_39931 [Cichorium endivia]